MLLLEGRAGCTSDRAMMWRGVLSFYCPFCPVPLRHVLLAGRTAKKLRSPLWYCFMLLWPSLQVPFPELQPAIFPPPFREPAPPALELFDLDDELASPLVSAAPSFLLCVALFKIASFPQLGRKSTLP